MKKSKLRKRAISTLKFFKEKDLGSLYLYFDADFGDYYIVVENEICDTEKYKSVINEYMRKFDISYIHVLPEKYIISTSDLLLVDKFIDYSKTDCKIL